MKEIISSKINSRLCKESQSFDWVRRILPQGLVNFYDNARIGYELGQPHYKPLPVWRQKLEEMTNKPESPNFDPTMANWIRNHMGRLHNGNLRDLFNRHHDRFWHNKSLSKEGQADSTVVATVQWALANPSNPKSAQILEDLLHKNLIVNSNETLNTNGKETTNPQTKQNADQQKDQHEDVPF